MSVPTDVPGEAPTASAPETAPAAPAATRVELERIPDSDPGPPFTILVDTIRIEEDGTYRLIGMVRNDGSETYEGIGVHASFLDENGGGYGPVDVYCPCPFLDPGAECPFEVEMYAREWAAYRLHPRGQPIGHRRPASVELSGITVWNDGIGNVHVAGTATNENAFAIKNPVVAGVLVDASGRIVSVGSVLVFADVAPGGSVRFDVRIEYEPHSAYRLYARATQG